jgi:hypothetical protein
MLTKHTRQIDFDHRGPVVVRVIDCGRATYRARVVDKNVDAAEAIECLRDEILCRFGFAEIAGDRMRNAASTFDVIAG